MISLFPHQQEALQETKDFDNIAVYHDMGLGKTFTGSEMMKRFGCSFGINQMLYGMMILSTTDEAIEMTDNDNKGVLKMEQIIDILKNKYGEDDMEVMTDNGEKYECTSQKMA